MNFHADPITVTEQAIIARLRDGMGRLVRSVDSYAGEMDEDIGLIIRAFPAAWVTFGGITDSTPFGISRRNYKTTGQFVIIVGQRSVRSERASRIGGPGPDEPGTYVLVRAVRRLLAQQDMGLPINPLRAGKVRTLYNTVAKEEAFSVFACEFATDWIEESLPVNHWPIPLPQTDPESATDPDEVFLDAGGKTGEVDLDWLSTGLNYFLQPDDGQADAQDIIDKE